MGQPPALRGGTGPARRRVPKPRGAFFGSLHGTLNHMVVADRVWLRRFTGDGPVQTRLDEILFEDLDRLEEARAAEDERIVGYIDRLSEADLASTFSYRTITQPQDITQPLAPALSHFFNHQTHHRGQAHGLITEIAGKVGGAVARPDALPARDRHRHVVMRPVVVSRGRSPR